MNYIAQPGDTVYSIARLFDLRTDQLLSANANLREYTVVPGEIFNIPETSRTRHTIDTNGYISPSFDPAALQDKFPYLTYLSIMSCQALKDGSLICEDDSAMVEAARNAKVGPLMVVSNYVPSEGYSTEIAHSIATDLLVQQRLLDNIIGRLSQKKYYGVNMDFELMPFEDFPLYAQFVKTLTYTLHPLGYLVMETLRTSRVILNIEELYPNPYGNFESSADRFVIKSSELVCDPYSALSPLDSLQRILDYTIGPFSSQRILIAYPNCCQIWVYPQQQGQQPQPIYYEQANLLASQSGGFAYDPVRNIQYFNFFDQTGMGYTVICGSVPATVEIAQLIAIYNLGGVSFRPANLFSLATYQMFNAMFNIHKVNI